MVRAALYFTGLSAQPQEEAPAEKCGRGLQLRGSWIADTGRDVEKRRKVSKSVDRNRLFILCAQCYALVAVSRWITDRDHYV